MLSITDLKKGTLVSVDNQPWRVVDYSQKVMGRGGSIVNVKLKNLVNGSTLDKTYKGNDSVQSADISMTSAQFLYSNSSLYSFMTNTDYDTITVNSDLLRGYEGFMYEGLIVNILKFNGSIVGVELPKNVDMKVTEAYDVVRGNTTGNISKIVKVSTGMEVSVPQFIKVGDSISIDTGTGQYRERTSS
jgi:elongation factor P